MRWIASAAAAQRRAVLAKILGGSLEAAEEAHDRVRRERDRGRTTELGGERGAVGGLSSVDVVFRQCAMYRWGCAGPEQN